MHLTPVLTEITPGVSSIPVKDGGHGVLGLAGKHGAARLKWASARAIQVGDPSYRTIKGILAAGTEADPPPPATGDAGAAAHLHGPSQLFANVVALPAPSSPPGAERFLRPAIPEAWPPGESTV